MRFWGVDRIRKVKKEVPKNIWPSFIWAYVCGFNGEEEKRQRRNIENQWQYKIHFLKKKGCDCSFILALSVNDIIAENRLFTLTSIR